MRYAAARQSINVQSTSPQFSILHYFCDKEKIQDKYFFNHTINEKFFNINFFNGNQFQVFMSIDRNFSNTPHMCRNTRITLWSTPVSYVELQAIVIVQHFCVYVVILYSYEINLKILFFVFSFSACIPLIAGWQREPGSILLRHSVFIITLPFPIFL